MGPMVEDNLEVTRKYLAPVIWHKKIGATSSLSDDEEKQKISEGECQRGVKTLYLDDKWFKIKVLLIQKFIFSFWI